MIVFLKKALLSLVLWSRQICLYLGCIKWTDNDQSAITSDDEVFPLRVINVRDTVALARGVCFSVPKDWNFHVISHTWSMKVRDWSVEIAGKIGEGGDAGSGYDEVFQNEDFSGRPYYSDFLKFLEMLAADRVEKVWFDALCINQTDAEEKSREILHMGSFYSQSLGCCVLTHGLGQGFGLLSKDGHLPRWFSRVWTLQEFLLPKELWFIVELDVETMQKVDSRLKSDDHMCFRELVNADSSDLYFVNRFGYESLLWEQFGGAQTEEPGLYPGTEEDIVQFKARLGAFWNLPRRSWITDRWVSSRESMVRLGHIPREVAFRDCTEGHEEDRVLSILALLGIEGRLHALRVGKSLDQQMLDLFTGLVEVDQHLLLALSAASVYPYPRPGMSWCPQFLSTRVSRWFNSPPSLDEIASTTQVVEVSARGLKLSCRFLRAQFLSFKVHKSRCLAPLHCISCTDDFRFSWVLEIQVGGSILTFPCLDVSEEDYLMFIVNPFECTANPRLKFLFGESGLVLNLQPSVNSGLEALPHFHPWLLLLGYHLYYEGDPSNSISSFLFMVCIGLNPDNLHKVGLLKVEEKTFGPGWDLMLHTWYDQLSPEGVFTVGGFGKIPLSQLQTDHV